MATRSGHASGWRSAPPRMNWRFSFRISRFMGLRELSDQPSPDARVVSHLEAYWRPGRADRELERSGTLKVTPDGLRRDVYAHDGPGSLTGLVRGGWEARPVSGDRSQSRLVLADRATQCPHGYRLRAPALLGGGAGCSSGSTRRRLLHGGELIRFRPERVGRRRCGHVAPPDSGSPSQAPARPATNARRR